MEYPSAKIAGHETKSVVAAHNRAGMETKVFDLDFFKPPIKCGGSRFNRKTLVVQDKSKDVKPRGLSGFTKDSRFINE